MLEDEHKSDVCAKICAVTTMQTHTATTYRISTSADFTELFTEICRCRISAVLIIVKEDIYVQNAKLTLCIIMSTESKQQKQLYQQQLTGLC